MHSKDLEDKFPFIKFVTFPFWANFSYINYSPMMKIVEKSLVKVNTNLITYTCFVFSGLFLDFGC